MPFTNYAQAQSLKSLSLTVNAMTAVTDVTIAAVLCYLLQKSRTGFRRYVLVAAGRYASLIRPFYSRSSDTLITKLIIFTVRPGTYFTRNLRKYLSLSRRSTLVFSQALMPSRRSSRYVVFTYVLSGKMLRSLHSMLRARTRSSTSASSSRLAAVSLILIPSVTWI